MERFVDDLFRNVPTFPREIKRDIVARAEGNPEMCRQLVRLLVDRVGVGGEHVHGVPLDDDATPLRGGDLRCLQILLEVGALHRIVRHHEAHHELQLMVRFLRAPRGQPQRASVAAIEVSPGRR